VNEGSGDAEMGLPDWATAKLTEACHRIQNQLGGRKLWYERFTDADRSKFTDPWPQVWDNNQGTIGMWCTARGTSWNRAIVEAAHSLGFLDVATRDALIAVLPAEDGNASAAHPTPDITSVLPIWRKASGELLYRGKVIREVKPAAANLRLILSNFQEAEWQSWIYDPFPPDPEASDRRRRAVASLNQGLTDIRFLCEGNGKKIRWEVVSSESADGTASQA
jgi:hypothetical protein